MKLTSNTIPLATLMLLAITSFAQNIKTDYDRGADFGQYKTYSWEKIQTSDQLWVGRIKSAVNEALAAKGWTELPSGGNATLFAIETTSQQRTLNTFYDNFGGWRWGGFGTSTTTTEVYKVGTLVVDIFDARSKQLIWRGSASETLSDKSDKNIKNLNREVQKLFTHFPPGGAKH